MPTAEPIQTATQAEAAISDEAVMAFAAMDDAPVSSSGEANTPLTEPTAAPTAEPTEAPTAEPTEAPVAESNVHVSSIVTQSIMLLIALLILIIAVILLLILRKRKS